MKRALTSILVVVMLGMVMVNAISVLAVDNWTYKNGGNDYIIKTNGTQEIKIPVDISDLPKAYENADGYLRITIERKNIFAFDGWIYFAENYSVNNGSFQGDSNSASSSTHFCKMKENGTQKREIGATNGNYGYWDVLGYENGYIYYMLQAYWAPEGDVYKVKLENKLTDLVTQGQSLNFSLGGEYWSYSNESYIKDNWIYYNDGEDYYKIKIDGTNKTKINSEDFKSNKNKTNTIKPKTSSSASSKASSSKNKSTSSSSKSSSSTTNYPTKSSFKAGTVYADLNTIWYSTGTYKSDLKKKDYRINGFSKPQCTWYALGRILETKGIRLILSGSGNGGTWATAVSSKAEKVKIENGKVVSNGTIKVTTTTDYNKVKEKSAASFMYYNEYYDDFYGHIIFIEDVTKENGKIYVYYSDGNVLVDYKVTNGVVKKKTLTEFKNMYNDRKAQIVNKEKQPIFRGYIQF